MRVCMCVECVEMSGQLVFCDIMCCKYDLRSLSLSLSLLQVVQWEKQGEFVEMFVLRACGKLWERG